MLWLIKTIEAEKDKLVAGQQILETDEKADKITEKCKCLLALSCMHVFCIKEKMKMILQVNN